MNHSPRELFDSLPDELAAGPVREWLLDAVRAYEHGLPLEQALGLTGPKARMARDTALQAAAMILAPDVDEPAAARILARHIDHFARNVLPLVRRNPDRAMSGWKLELHRAFTTGCVVPRTPKQLQEILLKKLPDA